MKLSPVTSATLGFAAALVVLAPVAPEFSSTYTLSALDALVTQLETDVAHARRVLQTVQKNFGGT